MERGPCSSKAFIKDLFDGQSVHTPLLVLLKQRCSTYTVPFPLLVSMQNPKGVRGSGLQLLEGSEGLREVISLIAQLDKHAEVWKESKAKPY